MIKVKDGYAKLIGTTYSGSADRVLLSNGGDKAVSNFAAASGVVTALGTNGNYVTWTKNGTANNLTVPYATKTDNIIPTHPSDVNSENAWTMFASTYQASNIPVSDYLSGITFATNNDSSYKLQFGISYMGVGFIRAQHGGVWKDWKQIAFVSDIPTKVSQLINDSGYVTGGPYLPLAGGSMNTTAKILAYTPAKGTSDVYNSAIELREATGSTTSCTDNMYDAPGITFHWGGWWVHKLNLHANDLYWDNTKIWHAGNDGSGSGLDADLLDGKQFVKSYNEASDINWSSLMWTANANCTDITSMSYAALMNVGTDLYRGWQIWNSINDPRLYWRPAKGDASGWAEVRVLLDNYNYTTYLGYIGTTAVQSSSAVQALTGISRISNSTTANLYLGNSGNQGWVFTQDICSHLGNSYWAINVVGIGWFKQVNIGYTYINSGDQVFNVSGNASITGDVNAGRVIISGPQPIVFTNQGSGTYNKATIEYSANGLTIERARKEDTSSGAIIPLIISQRGGGTAVKFSGNDMYIAGKIGIQNGTPKSNLSVWSYVTSTPSLGNLAVDGTVEFGVTNGYATYFWTDGSGRGSIQQGRSDGNATAYNLAINPLGGNVGIGMGVPSYKLDVASNARVAAIVMEMNDEINRYGGPLYLQHRGNVAGSQGDARTGNVIMCANGGNIGIGTASPTQKLTVKGNIAFTSTGIIGASYSDSDTTMYNSITINSSTGGIQYKSGSWTSGDHVAHNFLTSSNSSRLTIMNNSGNVGIGTSTPSYKLDVIGSLKSYSHLIDTEIKDHATPTQQCLVINSSAPQSGVSLTIKNSPGIGFHISSYTLASLVYGYSGRFNFINSSADGYAPVAASSFIKADSSNDYVLLGGGGHKSLSDLQTGYDSRYVNVTGDTMTGTLSITGTITSHNYHQIYNSGSYTNTAANVGGAIVIQLPITSSQFDMVNVEIAVYEYDTQAASKIIVGGHPWQGAWYNYSCSIIGGYNKGIRLGIYGGKWCIILGTSSTVWKYPGVFVTHIGTVYDNYSSAYASQCTLSLVTSESGFSALVTPTNVVKATYANNADTTDGVHIEWSGSQAASSTDWLAGWTADGTKLKAVKRADLSVSYASTANMISHSTYYYNGNVMKNSTSANTIFGTSATANYMFPSFMESHPIFNNYADVINFTGYCMYGGTQLATEHNAINPRVAIRKYNQSRSDWGDWTELLSNKNGVRWGGCNTTFESGTPASAVISRFTAGYMPDGNLLTYNTAGTEYAILMTCRPDILHGSALKWGYPDRYIRILRFTNGSAKTTDWEKIDAGYADSAGSAGSVAWGNVTGKPAFFSGDYNDLTNKPTIPTNTNQLTNGAGFITAASIPSSLPANGGNADTVDSKHAADFLQYVAQNSTFSSVENISTDLTPGIHRIHIYGKEYSSILTGKDYQGSYWQLYFHPSSGYTQDIKYRATNCTTWKTLLDSNNWSSFVSIPSVGNGTITITQAGTTIGSFTMNQSSDTTINLTDNNTNYYPMRSYTSGLQISSYSGSADCALYVPNATASQSGVVTTASQTFAGEKTFASIRLRSASTANYGGYLYFGDSSYAYLAELADDQLTINASKIFLGMDGTQKYYIDGTVFRPVTTNSTSTSGIALGNTSYRFTYGYFAASVYAYSGFYESSDERLKNILKPVKVNLDDLSKLRKVYYLWRDRSEDGIQLGMIAQDVQKLYPELVSVDKETGYLSLAYDRLSVLALEAIDVLYNDYKKLKERVDKLEKLLINKGIS